jgi:hypothetical protein
LNRNPLALVLGQQAIADLKIRLLVRQEVVMKPPLLLERQVGRVGLQHQDRLLEWA